MSVSKSVSNLKKVFFLSQHLVLRCFAECFFTRSYYSQTFFSMRQFCHLANTVQSPSTNVVRELHVDSSRRSPTLLHLSYLKSVNLVP
jgi:hypothetical protein